MSIINRRSLLKATGVVGAGALYATLPAFSGKGFLPTKAGIGNGGGGTTSTGGTIDTGGIMTTSGWAQAATTDQTATVQGWFDLVAQGQYVSPAPGDYPVSSTINLNYTQSVLGGGLKGRDVRLVSNITNGGPVLNITVAGTVLALGATIEGLMIQGNGLEGHGIAISAPNTGGFARASLDDVFVKNCGGDGIHIEGAVFESFLTRIRVFGCQNGMLMKEGADGAVPSTMFLHFFSIGENRQVGVILPGAANDLTMRDGYLLLNGKEGLVFNSGISEVNGVGFENNYTSGTGPAARGQVSAMFRNSGGGGNMGTEAGFLQMYVVDKVVLDFCGHAGYLVQATGPGQVVLRDSEGIATLNGALVV